MPMLCVVVHERETVRWMSFRASVGRLAKEQRARTLLSGAAARDATSTDATGGNAPPLTVDAE